MRRILKLGAQEGSGTHCNPARYERVLPIILTAVFIIIIALVAFAALVLAGVVRLAR